jgi:gamma-glutamyltranspeptidase
MELEDLKQHDAQVVTPISYTYKASEEDEGVTVWECP